MERHSSEGQDQQSQAVITADDLLKRAREGIKEVYEITLRGLTVPVRVLSIDEVQRVRREAIRQATITGGDDTDKNVETQKAVLKLASTLTKGGAPLLADRILSIMSLDEITYLYEEYIAILEAVNPSIEHLATEQFRALVDALKKNTITAKDCSIRQLRAICSAYVDLIQRQESPTSPPAS